MAGTGNQGHSQRKSGARPPGLPTSVGDHHARIELEETAA